MGRPPPQILGDRPPSPPISPPLQIMTVRRLVAMRIKKRKCDWGMATYTLEVICIWVNNLHLQHRINFYGMRFTLLFTQLHSQNSSTRSTVFAFACMPLPLINYLPI